MSDYGSPKDFEIKLTPESHYPTCDECGLPTWRLHDFLDKRICFGCKMILDLQANVRKDLGLD